MNTTKFIIGKLGIILSGALLGYTAYGQPAVSVGVSVPVPAVAVVLPSVEIHVESDFYEPLTPHGEWVVIGTYGRCWRPAHVAVDWRPYCEGSWQRTDVGWYWVSDEPWAWATYHYGRWDFTEESGWYWMPQTLWAPAWVSWHEGGGYVGWAPLHPSTRISVSGSVEFNVAVISPRAFVFVEQRHFLEPIRPKTVVVNNTTIINKTVNITNIKVANKTVVNEGPRTEVVERAVGRKVQAVPVAELRHKEETAVVARQQKAPAAPVKIVPPPVHNKPEPGVKKEIPPPVKHPVEKPAEIIKEKPAPGKPGEVPPPVHNKPEPGPKNEVLPPEKHPVEKPAEIIKDKPAPGNPDENIKKKDDKKKIEERVTPPEKPAAPC